MRNMKDSGIAWIGEIPEGWGIVLLSSIFKQRKEKNINNKDNNLLSLSYGKIIRKDITLSDGLLPQSFETYNIIDNGDIVFRLTDLQNDKRSLRTGLCKEKGIITSAYVTIRPAVELSSDYMQYLYHSYDICKVFYGMGDGVRQGMNYDDLRRLPTLFPKYTEQQQIADFLDKKCAEIDKLIELQESMIEKLKEYKQSVITQAVTKGLDPDVPMKDSGIEWIGKIPEGWGVVLLSSIFKQHKEKNINNKENNLLSLSYGKIIRKDILLSDGLLPQSFETYNIIDSGDIVFRLTDLQNDKRSLRTGLCKEKGIITSAYVTIRPAVSLSSEYMQYLYHSYDICKVFYGMGDGVRQGMSYDDLRRLPTLFPKYIEQQQIADYLDKKCAEIDDLIKLKEQKIEKLKEYKKSLIYEYVTGKKEVV